MDQVGKMGGLFPLYDTSSAHLIHDGLRDTTAPPSF